MYVGAGRQLLQTNNPSDLGGGEHSVCIFDGRLLGLWSVCLLMEELFHQEHTLCASRQNAVSFWSDTRGICCRFYQQHGQHLRLPDDLYGHPESSCQASSRLCCSCLWFWYSPHVLLLYQILHGFRVASLYNQAGLMTCTHTASCLQDCAIIL